MKSLAAAPVLWTAASAVLWAATFPPLALWPLAAIALVPLLAAAARTTPLGGALLGLLWGGLLAVACGAWFFPAMVQQHLGASPGVAWLGLIAVGIGWCGAFVAPVTALVAWCARRGGLGPLAFGAAWALAELARTRVAGNPWALAGFAHADRPALLQLADLAGPYSVGFLVAAVNAGVAAALVPRLRRAHPVRDVAVTSAVFALALVYGTLRLRQPFGEGAAVPVAAVQVGPIPAPAVARYAALSRATGAELLVWPEHAAPAVDAWSADRESVLAASRGLEADVLFGAAASRFGSETVHRFNTVFLMRDGRLLGRSEKADLLPFAERTVLGLAPAGRPLWTPGRSRPLRTSHGLVGALVCNEAMLPMAARRLANQGAELLAVLAYDGWLGHPAAMRHLLAMARFRAVETRRWLVRAGDQGVSVVVDPHGRVVAATPVGTDAIAAAPVRRSTALTPYVRWGDAWAFPAALLLVLSIAHARKPRHGDTVPRRSSS